MENNIIYNYYIGMLNASGNNKTGCFEGSDLCEKILSELVTKVTNANDKIDFFGDELVKDWITGVLDRAANDMAADENTDANELKKQFLTRITPPGCGIYSERVFAEDITKKIREYRRNCYAEKAETAEERPGMFMPEKSILFRDADLFEAAWRTIAGASCYENKAEETIEAVDAGNFFSETDKIMLPENITAGRLASALRVLDLITEKDVHTDEAMLLDCVDYDVFSEENVPGPMVYYCGKAIFEYCLEELFSPNNKNGDNSLDIREIFEDTERIAIPVSMNDERLRGIYNALTLNSDKDFADDLSVDQYSRVTLMDFDGFEKEKYISFSELEALMREYHCV